MRHGRTVYTAASTHHWLQRRLVPEHAARAAAAVAAAAAAVHWKSVACSIGYVQAGLCLAYVSAKLVFKISRTQLQKHGSA